MAEDPDGPLFLLNIMKNLDDLEQIQSSWGWVFLSYETMVQTPPCSAPPGTSVLMSALIGRKVFTDSTFELFEAQTFRNPLCSSSVPEDGRALESFNSTGWSVATKARACRGRSFI